jgi:hypothetical protein
MIDVRGANLYKDNKLYGQVQKNMVKKYVRKSKHMLRKPEAWCWDNEVLDYCRLRGINVAIVCDTEEDKTYVTPFVMFQARGFPLDRGFGVQTGLTLPNWTVV